MRIRKQLFELTLMKYKIKKSYLFLSSFLWSFLIYSNVDNFISTHSFFTPPYQFDYTYEYTSFLCSYHIGNIIINALNFRLSYSLLPPSWQPSQINFNTVCQWNYTAFLWSDKGYANITLTKSEVDNEVRFKYFNITGEESRDYSISSIKKVVESKIQEKYRTILWIINALFYFLLVIIFLLHLLVYHFVVHRLQCKKKIK